MGEVSVVSEVTRMTGGLSIPPPSRVHPTGVPQIPGVVSPGLEPTDRHYDRSLQYTVDSRLKVLGSSRLHGLVLGHRGRFTYTASMFIQRLLA